MLNNCSKLGWERSGDGRRGREQPGHRRLNGLAIGRTAKGDPEPPLRIGCKGEMPKDRGREDNGAEAEIRHFKIEDF